MLENVLRNSFLVDEGDAFNEILVNKTINELKSKRIFKSVNKTVREGSSNKFKIIDITIEEQPTGEFSAGAGTGTSGSTVSFGIKENNYLGKGQKLDTNFQISDTGMQGIFSVNIPKSTENNAGKITGVRVNNTTAIVQKNIA